ncbi:MAG: peptidoglycan DD-metalloendopeptidase family protein [Patescibacteria group bacterium]
MKKLVYFVPVLIVLILTAIALFDFRIENCGFFCSDRSNDSNREIEPKKEKAENINQENSDKEKKHLAPRSDNLKPEEGEFLALPLEKPKERVTKKDFGIYITPQNSPVEGERFRGYHTGVDWEVFPEEIDLEVPVEAICTGDLFVKKFVSGYGGVAVQKCDLEKRPVSVIYGHLDISSVSKNLGEELKAGEELGNLGGHKSSETDGERKHLHLGIYRGSNFSYRGYVDSEEELSDWIDPCSYYQCR